MSEQRVELGVQARRCGSTRKSGPSFSRRSPIEVLSSITTSHSPGKPASTSLSSPSTDAASAVASSRSRSALGVTGRLASCSSGLGHLLGGRPKGLDLLGDDARLVAILVVDAAADEHDRVGGERLAGGRQRVAEHEQLDRALEVVERREHHRVALLGPDLLGLADHAADQHPVAVALVGEVAPAGSRRGRRSAALTSLSGWAEMNSPIDSFSAASSSARSNSSRGSGRGSGSRSRRRRRRSRRRRRRSRGRRSSPARSAHPAAPSGRPPGPARAPSASPCGWRRSTRTRRT